MEELKRKNIVDKRHYIAYFIISFFVILLLSLAVFVVIEKEARIANFEAIKINENRIVSLENDYLGKSIIMILGDLNYLHNAYEFQLADSENYDEIAINWKEFSTQRNIYDQIRFIDASGDEKIRINNDERGGYIVPKSELKNKKDRYYFIETSKLPKQNINISQLDLNVENGKIEEPYKPVIRFSIPLHDENGELKGIIVLNYMAKNIIDDFRALARNSTGDIVLLNSEGYWIFSSNSNQEWNFMFDDKKNDTFEKLYPKEWNIIKSGNGQKLTNNGLFTYSKLSLKNKIIENKVIKNKQKIHLSDGDFYIVSEILKEGEQKSLFTDDFWRLIKDVIKKDVMYFGLIIIVSIIVGSLFAINREAYSKIKYYSEFDSLTKVYNRRAGIEKLNQMFALDDRRRGTFSLCFIDVNGLKDVNDRLGHKYGDELIVTVIEVIKSVIRESDFVMRLGGDEFMIVFNNSYAEDSEEAWNRIVSIYANINEEEDRAYLISVSHGIVSRDTVGKSQVDDLIKMADEKMYEEKRVIKENFKAIK